MKRLVFTLAMVFSLTMFAQQEKPILEKSGDMVKATYKNNEGVIIQQGFFKDGKPHGEWVAYNDKGEKIAIATYSEGKKVGTWFFYDANKLHEVNFENNVAVSNNSWVSTKTLATNP